MKIEDIVMMPAGTVIGREIVSASFEEWIAHVFDHPHAERHWRWDEDFVTWAVPALETVNFLARTFEGAKELLNKFSEEQVNDGLWYISFDSLSDISRTLGDKSVTLSARKQAVRSIRKLYSDCFAVRCVPILSHLTSEETLETPLNSACYMWWDGFPDHFRFTSDESAGDDMGAECLSVMEFALGLESDACRESALHGLGHWAVGYPERVKKIIDRFIETAPNAKPELIAYARKAREGELL